MKPDKRMRAQKVVLAVGVGLTALATVAIASMPKAQVDNDIICTLETNEAQHSAIYELTEEEMNYIRSNLTDLAHTCYDDIQIALIEEVLAVLDQKTQSIKD